MTPQDAKHMEDRLGQYRVIESRVQKIRDAINQLTVNREDDPNGQNPFTGNARESRQIDGIDIQFTKTRGGSPPVAMSMFDLGIEAADFKNAMLSLLRKLLSDAMSELDEL